MCWNIISGPSWCLVPDWQPSPGQARMGTRTEEIWTNIETTINTEWHLLYVGFGQCLVADSTPTHQRQREGKYSACLHCLFCSTAFCLILIFKSTNCWKNGFSLPPAFLSRREEVSMLKWKFSYIIYNYRLILSIIPYSICTMNFYGTLKQQQGVQTFNETGLKWKS